MPLLKCFYNNLEEIKMNIHSLLASQTPLAKMDMAQITASIAQLSQKYQTLRSEQIQKLFDQLPSAILQQPEIKNNEWEAFDKKMALVPLKEIACTSMLERLYEMEQIAEKRFQHIPKEFQPIVLSFRKKTQQEEPKSEKSEKADKAEKVDKPALSLEKDLEPELWIDKLLPRSELSQDMEGLLHGLEGKEGRIEFPQLDETLGSVIVDCLKTKEILPDAINENTITPLFQFAMQYDITGLKGECLAALRSLVEQRDFEFHLRLLGAFECYFECHRNDKEIFRSHFELIEIYWKHKLGEFSIANMSAYIETAKNTFAEKADLPGYLKKLQSKILLEVGSYLKRYNGGDSQKKDVISFFDTCIRPYLGKPGYEFLKYLPGHYFYEATQEWRAIRNLGSGDEPEINNYSLFTGGRFSVMKEIERLRLGSFLSSVVVPALAFDHAAGNPNSEQKLKDGKKLKEYLHEIFAKDVMNYDHVPKQIVLPLVPSTWAAQETVEIIGKELDSEVQAIWKEFLKERGLEEKLIQHSIRCITEAERKLMNK